MLLSMYIFHQHHMPYDIHVCIRYLTHHIFSFSITIISLLLSYQAIQKDMSVIKMVWPIYLSNTPLLRLQSMKMPTQMWYVLLDTICIPYALTSYLCLVHYYLLSSFIKSNILLSFIMQLASGYGGCNE